MLLSFQRLNCFKYFRKVTVEKVEFVIVGEFEEFAGNVPDGVVVAYILIWKVFVSVASFLMT